MIFGSWSRRRASACFSGEAACSSGGTASALGRLPFRRGGRVVPGPAEPVGVTPSEPGGRLHGIGDPAEELCATAVHVGGTATRGPELCGGAGAPTSVVLLHRSRSGLVRSDGRQTTVDRGWRPSSASAAPAIAARPPVVAVGALRWRDVGFVPGPCAGAECWPETPGTPW